ncbi:TPA: potassium-transporting ATPase subunit KdpB [Campylobacter jejuni]|uniref:potassium-transporting ATPase subunit KdpB n=1 Tax=Campylobacter jejuni TaxID=197 RepID=UPI0011A683A7|nr:potassium-transporting ATPase subunit KdpB [Campylobacter jejuni]HAN0569475.1 potassium-transporting ATPase subunit KdpB [Campylobacter jejuni]HAN0592365.1 potassium-transporting ATPase subunit KdpB [Campylobacter jejuni]HAN0749846.1 potassium-transporting ATPase subunit KdpB [Campylobacter jejuni]HDX3466979.1 potassium-transporting ATPase subunit KdpB [Campylobacter jejuni]HDX3564251.1 potassium-transporting ATPase subunit KdpB [Campylobacter jejuni]
MSKKQNKLITKEILNNAIKGAFLKFDPRFMVKNPVMFMVEVGLILTLILSIFPTLFNGNSDERIYNILITFILFITLLFANFAESIAEGRGKAQAAALRQSKKDSKARRIKSDGSEEMLNSSELKIGDIVLVKAGELIPNDGEIIEGAASVDESAITGESAPVMREAGGDFSSVTGGTTVLTDFLKIKILVGAGESFLDKMINLVEGAARQKTPNEIALNTLLIVLSLSFLMVVISLYPFMQFLGVSLPISWLVALLVCLIPTTIGGFLSAIGIAGMDRVTRFNVIALSGKAVESCGDVDAMILDKTGTITFGNRLANEFYEVQGISKEEMIKACVLSSLKDETPEGKSIIALAQKMGYELKGNDIKEFIEFSAQNRMSGVDLQDNTKIRKGAFDAIRAYISEMNGKIPSDLETKVMEISNLGGTPLVVCKNEKILGVIYLKDTVKPGLKERFDELRKMGIKTLMCTGDNPLTAATIAKEAANMIDLDSNPTKILEVVEIGKGLLITRGSLTTFSMANDIAKCFAILPAMFSVVLPQMQILNIMHLATPQSAILSALIFNAIIIPLLIPIAMRGVKFKPMKSEYLLLRNLSIYGLGDMIAPFIGIKIIDIPTAWILRILGV